VLAPDTLTAQVYGAYMRFLGYAILFAIVAAMVVTIIRRNDFIAVITGMAVAALARALGFAG